MGTFISSLRESFAWLIREFLKVFTSPSGVIGSFFDAARGWKYSRQSTRFWFNLPAFVIVASVYLIFTISLFERVDSKVQRYNVVGEKRLPTRQLEYASFRQFAFMNPQGQPLPAAAKEALEIPDFAKSFAALLVERILSVHPTNAQARYRQALLASIDEDMSGAMEVMTELAEGASGKYGVFRPANAWIAAWLIQAREDRQPINASELGRNLLLASDWPEVPVQLLAIYSQVLEQNGYRPKAIEIAREAAKRVPEMNLELARLYGRMKKEETQREDGLREASYRVEEVFGARLNTSNERDIDRLAIAEVRFLTGKNTQAIAVLQEGLVNGKRPMLSRSLSSLYLSIFEQSIEQRPDGTFSGNMELLDNAVAADPTDPKISEQIVTLQNRGITPTKHIVGVLRKQLEEGITSAETHRILAERYFKQNNLKEAIRNWEIVLAKNPNDIATSNNLALILAKDKKENLPRSLELIAKANAMAPENVDVLDTYGEILMLSGKTKEAISRFEQAIRLDKTRLATCKKLLQAYKEAGLTEMAKAEEEVIKELEKALGSGR